MINGGLAIVKCWNRTNGCAEACGAIADTSGNAATQHACGPRMQDVAAATSDV